MDAQLGLPYEMLDDLSVREQRVIVKRRIEEMRRIENYKIKSMTKSPTKPIDTPTNTRLYLRQMSRNNQQLAAAQTIQVQANSTMQSQFERRSRSNLPYSKKPPTTRSDTSDLFGETTTAATASPTFRNNRHALSVAGSDPTQASQLQEVSEYPFPKNALTNEYRKTRLLHKGCPKLLRLVDKQHAEIEKSIKESQRVSQRLISNIDRIKLSIMSTRSNAIQTPSLSNTLEDRYVVSGLYSTKNA